MKRKNTSKHTFHKRKLLLVISHVFESWWTVFTVNKQHHCLVPYLFPLCVSTLHDSQSEREGNHMDGYSATMRHCSGFEVQLTSIQSCLCDGRWWNKRKKISSNMFFLLSKARHRVEESHLQQASWELGSWLWETQQNWQDRGFHSHSVLLFRSV